MRAAVLMCACQHLVVAPESGAHSNTPETGAGRQMYFSCCLLLCYLTHTHTHTVSRFSVIDKSHNHIWVTLVLLWCLIIAVAP